MAAAALFLAAKVEEQPRKLEHVIKVAHMCLNRDQPPLDTKSEVSELLCCVACITIFFCGKLIWRATLEFGFINL